MTNSCSVPWQIFIATHCDTKITPINNIDDDNSYSIPEHLDQRNCLGVYGSETPACWGLTTIYTRRQ